jgi:hypothetical protein
MEDLDANLMQLRTANTVDPDTQEEPMMWCDMCLLGSWIDVVSATCAKKELLVTGQLKKLVRWKIRQ